MKNYNEMAESVLSRRDEYVAERKRRTKKMTNIISCLCICALLCVGVFNGNQITTDDTLDVVVQNYQENKFEEDKESAGNGEDINSVQNSEDIPADKDGAYKENINSSDLKQGTSSFFGGSYTNTNGQFVVVLTIDTAENRIAICKELGISQNSTVFEVGAYTLEYLTELQNKISSAMTDKKIPFVTSSGVYEDINRIKVSVTTNNEVDLAKVLALDTIGGAIVIEEMTGVVTEDLAVKE